MLNTVRLLIDATVALAIMATLAAISALAAAAITDDRMLVIMTAGAVFTLAGAVALVRLWRMSQKPVAGLEPGA